MKRLYFLLAAATLSVDHTAAAAVTVVCHPCYVVSKHMHAYHLYMYECASAMPPICSNMCVLVSLFAVTVLSCTLVSLTASLR
jgi:hypothetical protein